MQPIWSPFHVFLWKNPTRWSPHQYICLVTKVLSWSSIIFQWFCWFSIARAHAKFELWKQTPNSQSDQQRLPQHLPLTSISQACRYLLQPNWPKQANINTWTSLWGHSCDRKMALSLCLKICWKPYKINFYFYICRLLDSSLDIWTSCSILSYSWSKFFEIVFWF